MTETFDIQEKAEKFLEECIRENIGNHLVDISNGNEESMRNDLYISLLIIEGT